MLSEEFMVLGSSTLTELRDRLYCLSDQHADGLPSPSLSTKSGYFFIENVFYNDMRNPNNIDYSRTVIEWGNTHREWLGMVVSCRMEQTKFEDLTIRLNTPYLYVHQGNCEHFFVFTELRLFAPDLDNTNRKAYPVHMFQCKIRRRKCRICDIYPAKYVTFSDKLSPENPCFFCDFCYRPFHYTPEGQLKYSDYEVYNYYHE